jgi:SfnB family sulfur acquisition oxidoreductase
MHDMPLPAARITGDEAALAAAGIWRDRLAEGAQARDRTRTLPRAEVEALSQAGLWAITVPAEHGGADVSHATLAEITVRLAEGDPSVAQIPQNPTLETLRLIGTAAQRADIYAWVLGGARFGNAEAERGAPTRIRPEGHGFRIEGRKAYRTGALFAHLITVTARDEEDRPVLAIVDRDASGLTILDDWSGMGQRTTASGSVMLEDVTVAPGRVLPLWQAFERRTPIGSFAQLLHAAIDLGIGRAALREAARFVRTRSRPFGEAGVARAQDDPLLVERFGQLAMQVHAADAMLVRAASALDAARAEPSDDALAQAAIAVAEARALTTEAALQASTGLFELAGTHATLAEYGLDRFWRDARTHTLHDPVRWKYYAIGNYHLNGVSPPVRSYL